MRRLLGTVFMVLVAAAPAVAQDRPVGVNFGFGVAFPIGPKDFKDDFNTGWDGGAGVTFNVTPVIGVQAEYMYYRFGGPDRTINISTLPEGGTTSTSVIESNHQMQTVTFNMVYTPSLGTDRPVGAYVLGGGGYYHRLIQLTTPAVGYTTICDPYWLVCYPTLVSVDKIIGDKSSDDFGINFGGGITFGTDVKFYVEARYHYVWGKEVKPQAANLPAGLTVPCAEGCSTNAQYVPLTFGVRW